MNQLRQRLLGTLAATGPVGSRELCRRLGISQPTFSRLVRSVGDRLLVFGRGRATRYAARRVVPQISASFPVYEVRPTGEVPRHLLTLYPVEPRGYVASWEDAAASGTAGSFHPDLPWFLQDIRPAGFLGRLLARRHENLGYPEDIRFWSSDQVLGFVSRLGWDLPGAFIIGDEAWRRFSAEVDSLKRVVDLPNRGTRYPMLAEQVLQEGPAGSSAAGEQPKFLTTRRSSDALTPVLVKFSPPLGTQVARRVADLLVTEHLVHEELRARGFAVPTSEILVAGHRTFLEVERFDRQGTRHRVGQATLASLDAEFVGSDLTNWETSVGALVRLGKLPAPILERVRWLGWFGRYIGNTDMHFGNLAFLLDGVRPTALAPIYDMLPMCYFPRHQELPPVSIHPPIPTPSEAQLATSALEAANSFWYAASHDKRISADFQQIALGQVGTRNRPHSHHPSPLTPPVPTHPLPS